MLLGEAGSSHPALDVPVLVAHPELHSRHRPDAAVCLALFVRLELVLHKLVRDPERDPLVRARGRVQHERDTVDAPALLGRAHCERLSVPAERGLLVKHGADVPAQPLEHGGRRIVQAEGRDEHDGCTGWPRASLKYAHKSGFSRRQARKV